MNIDVNEVEFHILPRYALDPQVQDLHNRTYALWKKVWYETFVELNFACQNLPDEYSRQEFFAALTIGSEVIGCHLYSIHPLKSHSHLESQYIHANFPREFIAELHKRGANICLSWEYLTVARPWRKSATSIPFGQIIIALAARILPYTPADVAIAPTRNSHKVNKMTSEVGGISLFTDIDNHNVKCDLIAVFRAAAHDPPDRDLQRAVSHLWDNRKDYTGMTLSARKSINAA